MESERLDRLSALVSRFALEITPDAQSGNLAIYAEPDSDVFDRVLLLPRQPVARSALMDGPLIFFAALNWQGGDNPLMAALPESIELHGADDPELAALAGLVISESRQPRCGSTTVLAKLAEVLLIRILRQQIASGSTRIGLLGGLADPRLSRAIVAMHNHPGYGWTNALLAAEAGLSLSRFADRFSAAVGQSPMAYLRQWRMLLVRQDLARGDRVQLVAARYGYSSSEALARAFRRSFGVSPKQTRPE